MCGRYYVEPESSDELLELIVEAKRKSDEVKTGEVFPTDTAAVIANNRQLKPAVFPMRWGFERKGGGLVINARSETAAEKQLFRESAQLRRCLIPASCYFEWERRADGKVKYAIRPKGKELLYLGGLYTKPEPGALPRFTILTRKAADGISFIHDRMPVIVPKEKEADWLSQQLTLDGSDRPVQDMNFMIPAEIVDAVCSLVLDRAEAGNTGALPYLSGLLTLSWNPTSVKATAQSVSLGITGTFTADGFTVTDAFTGTASSAFMAGDVIRTIGGADIDGYIGLTAALYRATGRTADTTVTVLRGGAETEITINLR